MDVENQTAIIQSLETLSQADGYYKWLVGRMRAFIQGKTLEVGAGIGNFGRWAQQFASEYHVTDVDHSLVARLQQEFTHAFCWDIYEPFPVDTRYDTIIILNVVEHLENDSKALQALYDRLLPNGHVIIMVPAMRFLFGSLDRAFGHFRRYKKDGMKIVMEKAGFQVLQQEYVNVIGMAGWFLYGRILKHKHLPQQLCSRFNLVLPLLHVERPFASFMGLSLISIGKK